MKQEKLLRNFFVIAIIFSCFINVGTVSAENPGNLSKKELENQRVIETGKKQMKLIGEFNISLKKKGLSLENVPEIGDYYFTEKGMVIHYKDPTQSKDFLSKARSVIEIANELKVKNNNIEIISVEYSYDDLVKMQNEFRNYAKQFNIKNYKLVLNVEENRLDLIIERVSPKISAKLKEIYGNAIFVIEDSSILLSSSKPRLAAKSRVADWNSVGAGIGIKMRQLNRSLGIIEHNKCTTAGIAHKNGQMWVMTAGHCVEDLESPIYQFDATLGTKHLNALPSDYDFGLISVNGSGITRYATNGLYENSGSTTTGYDSFFSGSTRPSQNLSVCKAGITTNKTCGYISVVRTQDNFGMGEVYSTVKSSDGSILATDGDSGGPWYTTDIDGKQLLVGISAFGIGAKSSEGVGGYSSIGIAPFIEVAQKYGIYLYTNTTKTPF